MGGNDTDTFLALAFPRWAANIRAMAFKPNYNQQRAERDRLKREKREEKLRLQAERTAARKGVEGAVEPTEPAAPSGDKS